MKTIEPIPIWVKGEVITATIFNMHPTAGGKLYKSANFIYQLVGENNVLVSQGNLMIDGEDYQLWGTNDDYPFEWAASKLNLTITGDYIPPVIEQIIREPVIESTTREQKVVIE